MTYDIEAALRNALNGGELPRSRNASLRKNFAPPSYHPHKATLRYSVQESWGGPRFVVEYSKNTISRTEVETMAAREIAKRRYSNVVLLEFSQS